MPKKLLKKVMPIRKEKIELPLMNFRPSIRSWTGVPVPPRAMFGTFRLRNTAAKMKKPTPDT